MFWCHMCRFLLAVRKQDADSRMNHSNMSVLSNESVKRVRKAVWIESRFSLIHLEQLTHAQNSLDTRNGSCSLGFLRFNTCSNDVFDSWAASHAWQTFKTFNVLKESRHFYIRQTCSTCRDENGYYVNDFQHTEVKMFSYIAMFL